MDFLSLGWLLSLFCRNLHNEFFHATCCFYFFYQNESPDISGFNIFSLSDNLKSLCDLIRYLLLHHHTRSTKADGRILKNISNRVFTSSSTRIFLKSFESSLFVPLSSVLVHSDSLYFNWTLFGFFISFISSTRKFSLTYFFCFLEEALNPSSSRSV